MGRNGREAMIVALAMVATIAAGGALAHDTQGESATTPGARAALMRHDNFEKMGAAFKQLNDELRKRDPSVQLVAQSAAAMNTLAGQLPTWFPRGSGQEARPKSEARAEIWSDAAGFSAAASNLRAQTAKLHQLASTGDMDAVRTQVRATGGACKACHDNYRVQKD